MDMAEKSLRLVIEKWLAPTPGMAVRVTRFSRIRSTRRRFVIVEVSRAAGELSIMFFRHDDGIWRVFPPQAARPAMSVSLANGPIGGGSAGLSRTVPTPRVSGVQYV